MSSLRRLAVVTTAMTFLLVAVGGLVRATGSGLGCPDWPRCHGSWVPPGEYHALIEYSHRLIAFVVIVLTVALAVVALRLRSRVESPVDGSSPGGSSRCDRGRPPPRSPADASLRRARRLAVVTVPVVFSQALLGALVVALELHAESVVAHLLVAMTLLAVLLSLVVETTPSVPAPGAAPSDRGFARALTAVTASALALMLLGSYVSGREAGLAFPDWPLFDGRLLPAEHGVVPDLHFAHRLLAAVVTVAVLALARTLRRRPQAPAVAVCVRGATHLILLEVLVGAGNVWTELSPVTRTAHLALGAAVFGFLFLATRLAWRLPAPAAGDLPVTGSDPARDRAPVGSPA